MISSGESETRRKLANKKLKNSQHKKFIKLQATTPSSILKQSLSHALSAPTYLGSQKMLSDDFFR